MFPVELVYIYAKRLGYTSAQKIGFVHCEIFVTISSHRLSTFCHLEKGGIKICHAFNLVYFTPI